MENKRRISSPYLAARVLLVRRGFPLRLLAGRMVELGYTEHVSHETVHKVLKKTTSVIFLC
jgi:hypothetical protein